MNNGVNLVYKLNKSEVVKIQALEKECNQNRAIFFKIDPNVLSDGNDNYPSHILYYQQDKLTGYMSICSFNNEEIESTVILNDNKNAFNDMYKAINQEADKRGFKKILFIIDKNDELLVDFVKSLGFVYSFSEYRMNFDKTNFQASQNSKIIIRDANCNNVEEIIRLNNYAFGDPTVLTEIEDISKFDTANIKMAFMNDEIIGKITVEEVDGIFAIYGFVVKPEYQGKGYGREILNSVIKSMLERDFKKIYLEVVINNSNALHLYKTSGFYIEATFEYYQCIK